MRSSDSCAYCGSTRDVAFYGNVRRYPRGRVLCDRCVAIENRRTLSGKRSPRLVARALRVVRRWIHG